MLRQTNKLPSLNRHSLCGLFSFHLDIIVRISINVICASHVIGNICPKYYFRLLIDFGITLKNHIAKASKLPPITGIDLNLFL